MSDSSKEPFFSVIIPTYNRAALILDTIKTVIAQEYQNFEIIVVDDGSTDNTEEIIKAYNHPKIIYHRKENEERAVARNTGTQLAKGDYVTFFDSDDYLYPNHFTEAIKLIEQHNNPEFFYLPFDIMDASTRKIIKKQEIHPYTDFNKMLINGNYLSCNGVFLRKDVALQHPFNTDRDLSASEDYDLWLHLAARYTIYHGDVITSTLLNHDYRSVLIIKKEPLIKRIQLLIRTCSSDVLINKIYKEKLDIFRAKCYLYLSLHLAMSKHKKEAIYFFLRGIKEHPPAIFYSRVYGIMKSLLIY